MELCSGGAVDSLYRNCSRQLSEDEIGVLIMESLKVCAGIEYQVFSPKILGFEFYAQETHHSPRY